MLETSGLNHIFTMSQKVYSNLADSLSKAVFAARMNYNLTNDKKYLFDMVELNPNFDPSKHMNLKVLSERLQRISEHRDARIIVYGAGNYSGYLLQLFGEINWYAFCDRDINKQGTLYYNLPVISPEELLNNHKTDYVVISSPYYYEEVFKELQISGFPANQIVFEDLRFMMDLDVNQYFETPIITPQSNEVFIDAGCFNCDTSLLFRKWCGGKYEKIYAFEPDPANYRNCQSVIDKERIHNIELLNAGVWSQDDRLQFNSEESSASSFDPVGAISIDVRSIDSVLQGARATFIKLDVEGAELEALKGARETIVKYRPRLAVCVYHKPEDLLELQLYLQSLVPDYKFYIRHYSNFTIETVLYAV